MPSGSLVKLPLPFPTIVVESRCWLRVNVALTVFVSVIVTEQTPVPVQAPPQPSKVEPVSAMAVRVTKVEIG